MIRTSTLLPRFGSTTLNFVSFQSRTIMTAPMPIIAQIDKASISYDPRRCVQTIQVGGHRIRGISIAAVETCICFPSLSLAFDIGKCPAESIPMRYVAITHGHCDHVHGLPLHVATRNLQKLGAAKYFLSPIIEPGIRNLIDAVGNLENTCFTTDLHTISAEDEAFEFKKNWLLKPFKTYHTVPSQGYIIYKKKKRLRHDLIGLTCEELVRLRESGVEIDEQTTNAEIAFTGDTTLDAIANCEDCRNARILITEMTFIDNSSNATRAREFGHMHLDEIIERSDLFERNEYVIFTHFSGRYSSKMIFNAIERLPKDLRSKCIAFGI